VAAGIEAAYEGAASSISEALWGRVQTKLRSVNTSGIVYGYDSDDGL
jgi:hypothetical protein